MRVIFTTGGTAGHVFPALATAEALQERDSSTEILFIGASGLEKELVTQTAISFHSLPVQGIMGKGYLHKLKAIILMLYSCVYALMIVFRYKPDVVVGFGGYASFPSLVSAIILRIPIVLHEQNSIPGTVTKVLGAMACEVCTSFEMTQQYFPKKTVICTGNPIRNTLSPSHEIVHTSSTHNILIMGGSLGAMKINALIASIAPILIDKGFELWHQTGRQHYHEVCRLYNGHGIHSVRIVPFIENMEEAYTWADFAICRAGASTIAELACMAVPAIFIPFPYAVHNHQYYNARALVDAGAALCCEEKQITTGSIVEAIEHIATYSVLSVMRERMYGFAKYEAARHLVNEIYHCAETSS